MPSGMAVPVQPARGRLRTPLLAACIVAAALLIMPAAEAGARGAESAYSGVLQTVIHDDVRRDHSVTVHRLRLRDGRSLTLRSRSPRLHELSGRAVRVRGARRGLRLSATTVEPASQTFTASSSTPLGALQQRRVAVLLVNFANDRRQPWTLEQASAMVFGGGQSANNLMSESTASAIGLSGSVFGWFAIDDRSDKSCSYNNWGTKARAAATAQGIDLRGFQHVVYAFPAAPACTTWGGMAELPGDDIWMNGTLDQPHLFDHELGHNLGLNHATSWRCTNELGWAYAFAEVGGGIACERSEYGDHMDFMGSGLIGPSVAHKRVYGIVPPEAVQTVTAFGRYTLAPNDGQRAGSTLKIPRAYNNRPYFVEYRVAHGIFENFPAGSPVTEGVAIRTGPATAANPEPSPDATRILDMSPWPVYRPGADYRDLVLLEWGRTFFDPAGNVTITAKLRDGLATIDYEAAPPFEQRTTAEVNGGETYVTAGPGQNNSFAVRPAASGATEVYDVAAPMRLTAGTSCRQPMPGAAVCPAAPATIEMGPGDDTLHESTPSRVTATAADGNDRVVGDGQGQLIVSYRHARTAVTVDLGISSPQQTGGGGIDRLNWVTGVIGSALADTLRSNPAYPGLLDGGAGQDWLIGSDQADRIVALDGDSDYVDCGGGADSAVVDPFDYVMGCEDVSGA